MLPSAYSIGESDSGLSWFQKCEGTELKAILLNPIISADTYYSSAG